MKKSLLLLALAAGLGVQGSATTFLYTPYAIQGGGPGWTPGVDVTSNLNTAVKFNSPAELNGWKLVELQLASSTFKTYATSFGIWWSQNLPTSQPDGELVNIENLNQNNYKVTFATPKVLNGTDFYIGCNVGMDTSKYSSQNLWYSMRTSKQPGTWLQQNADGTWADHSAEKGGIFLQAVLEAPDGWQDNMVSVSVPKVTTFKKNMLQYVALPMFNYSTYSVNRFAYTVTIDGQEVISSADYKMATTSNDRINFAPLYKRYLQLTLPADKLDLAAGAHTMTITLSKIGNVKNTLVDNQATDKSVSFEINIVDDLMPVMNQDAVVSDYNGQTSLGWFNVGDGSSASLATFSGARKYTANDETKGMQIVGARIDKLCYGNYAGNDCLWLSSTLGDEPDGEVVYAEPILDPNASNRGSLTVKFANPVEFTEDGIYVGISRDMVDYNRNNYTAMISYLKDDAHMNIADGCWLKNDYNGWTDNKENGGMPFTLYLKRPDTPAGIVELTPDGEAVQYFDLQGRQVLTPAHGIFIKKQGNKATKVIK